MPEVVAASGSAATWCDALQRKWPSNHKAIPAGKIAKRIGDAGVWQAKAVERKPDLEDLTSSSLNFLSEFERKTKPVNEAILNYYKDIEKDASESHSAGSEMLVVQPPPARTEMQDSVPRYLGQQTSSLPADQNDAGFCNTVARGEPGLSVEENPKHESTAGVLLILSVSAVL
jgi:hypothetical protein